jgi:predicted RND superfamily exporter protein
MLKQGKYWKQWKRYFEGGVFYMVRKSIFCFIICITLFFSLGNLLASNEESQNQVISQSKVVKYYKTIEESESQEKSSQVIITNIIFAQVLYINESQTIEV